MRYRRAVLRQKHTMQGHKHTSHLGWAAHVGASCDLRPLTFTPLPPRQSAWEAALSSTLSHLFTAALLADHLLLASSCNRSASASASLNWDGCCLPRKLASDSARAKAAWTLAPSACCWARASIASA